MHAGGSIQGREALRLARLFLVFEAAGQVAPPPPRDPSSSFPSPWRTPKTPLGQRTFAAFFQSPCTPTPVKVKEATMPKTSGSGDDDATTPKAVRLVSMN